MYGLSKALGAVVEQARSVRLRTERSLYLSVVGACTALSIPVSASLALTGAYVMGRGVPDATIASGLFILIASVAWPCSVLVGHTVWRRYLRQAIEAPTRLSEFDLARYEYEDALEAIERARLSPQTEEQLKADALRRYLACTGLARVGAALGSTSST